MSRYLSTITAGRDRWSYSLRESAALYFTQIARLCNGQEECLEEIHNELLRTHFAIVLLLSKGCRYEGAKENGESNSMKRRKCGSGNN